MHHIVADGWSLGVLFARAGGALRARSPRAAAAAARAAVQYADYARLAARVAGAARRWRRSWPTGASSWPARRALELPTDRPRPAGADASAARLARVQLPRGAARGGCDALSRAEGATLFMTLLAAFEVLLAPLQRADATSWSARRSPAAAARDRSR